MVRKTSFIVGALSLAALVAVFSQKAAAQVLPPKVTILVAFSAGGSTDFTARQLAEGFRRKLGISAIVENRVGGGGLLAANALKDAEPDGATLMVTGQGLMTTNPHVLKMPFDPLKAFTPVAGLTYTDIALVVGSSVPANDLKEYVELARKSNPPLAFAHAGLGTAPHLYAERLKSLAKIDFNFVPYRGAQPAFTDVAGGFVSGFIGGALPAIPLIEAKKAKAIGILGEKRSPLLPGIATFAEQGFPMLDVSWTGLIAPAHLPIEKARAIARIAAEIMNEEPALSAMATAGIYPWTKDADEFAKIVQEESDTWKDFIVKNNIRVE